jgi:DNA-binding NarL/FixJ family response regulator
MELTVQIITSSKLSDLHLGNDFEIVGCYDDDVKALVAVENIKPSVILLEYDLEETNTELYIRSLLIESPQSKIILLGKSVSDEIILDCLMIGIYGYLDSKDAEQFLNKAILSVGQGQAWVSRRLVGLLMEKFRG